MCGAAERHRTRLVLFLARPGDSIPLLLERAPTLVASSTTPPATLQHLECAALEELERRHIFSALARILVIEAEWRGAFARPSMRALAQPDEEAWYLALSGLGRSSLPQSGVPGPRRRATGPVQEDAAGCRP